MAEYIEREALITKFKKMELGEHALVERLFADGVYAVIAAFPAADVAPVVHGHWVEKELFIPWCDDDVDIIYECSCCRTESGGTSPYCPNCGAKMDGGADNA